MYTGIIATLCPCHIVGKNAEGVGEGYRLWCLADAAVRIFLADVFCGPHLFIRQKIREEKHIQVSGKECLL